MIKDTYISKDYAPFFEDLRLVVVVDVEFGEKEFVLVRRVCSLRTFH